jgi:hypothetical protein
MRTEDFQRVSCLIQDCRGLLRLIKLEIDFLEEDLAERRQVPDRDNQAPKDGDSTNDESGPARRMLAHCFITQKRLNKLKNITTKIRKLSL